MTIAQQKTNENFRNNTTAHLTKMNRQGICLLFSFTLCAEMPIMLRFRQNVSPKRSLTDKTLTVFYNRAISFGRTSKLIAEGGLAYQNVFISEWRIAHTPSHILTAWQIHAQASQEITKCQ